MWKKPCFKEENLKLRKENIILNTFKKEKLQIKLMTLGNFTIFNTLHSCLPTFSSNKSASRVQREQNKDARL